MALLVLAQRFVQPPALLFGQLTHGMRMREQELEHRQHRGVLQRERRDHRAALGFQQGHGVPVAVARVRQRLENGAARGEIRADVGEIHAWAIGGMNVFLGMRYGLWDEDADIEGIARIANDLLANGLKKQD